MSTPGGSLVGARIGRYRITDLVGKGGMGEVWVAFDEKLERKVALKSIRSEYRLDEEARERFLREARVLSRLGHPNICGIHDWVEGEEGEFLVLELIDGRPLGERLRKGIPPKTAMKIAGQVASVLVAAHEEGIIHRDLKPDNVLVTAGDDAKVLDFGLSRWLGREATVVLPGSRPQRPAADVDAPTVVSAGGDEPATRREPGLTTRGSILGTLGWMSPEQARGEPATAASDMYSFGLLLQALFTGKTPFEPGEDTGAALERARRGEVLPISGLDPDLERLVRRLESLSPVSRPTAVDAAERLAFIRDKPVRLRRKLLVAGAMGALVLFGAAMTVQTIRARRAERAAQQAAKSAEQVSDFLVGVFRVSDPNEAKGSRVTARELLDKGADRIRREPAGEPQVQARLTGAIGAVYLNLGLYAEAEPLLEKALRDNEAAFGPEHPEVARSLQSLANLYRSRGRWDDAERLARRALAIREKAFGPDHPDVATGLNLLGVVLATRGKYAEAEGLFRRALAIQEKALGPEHSDLARTLYHLADLHRNQGRLAEAEPFARRALGIQEKTLGADHPVVASALASLAAIDRRLGKLDEAELLGRRALAIREKVLGPEHPDVAASLNNVAAVLLDRGDRAGAEPLFRRSLAIYEKALGPEHPTVASSLANLASVLLDLGRPADAEPPALRSLSIRERILPTDHPDLARTLGVVAQLRLAEGRPAEAEPLARRSLGIFEKALGGEHPDTASALQLLGDVLLRRGNPAEAEPLFRRALEIDEKALGAVHPATGEAAIRLARLAAGRGERAEAVALVRRAVEGRWSAAVLAADRELAPLRGDPEFERILAEGKGS